MRYLEGITLDAFGRGNRRLLAPVLAWAKEPVAVPVPEAAAEEPKAAEGDKPAKGSPAKKLEKTEPTMRRRIGVRHLGYAAGGAFFLWPVVGGWVPTVLTTAPVVWGVAALIAGQQGDHDHDSAAEDDDQEQPQDTEAGEADRGTALLLHVVTALSDAEYTRRTGVHLDVVLASAVAAGLLAEDTEVSALRAWVEAAGLPTTDKLGMRINGVPTTRVGLRVDAATAALGMTPMALLTARSQASVRDRGEARTEAVSLPAQAVGEGPAEAAAGTPAEAPVPAPASTPVPAALRLIPGGLLDPNSTTSLPVSQGQAQGAR